MSLFHAQRRPESEPRRHDLPHRTRAAYDEARNEGRSLNPGDTRLPARARGVPQERSTKAGV